MAKNTINGINLDLKRLPQIEEGLQIIGNYIEENRDNLSEVQLQHWTIQLEALSKEYRVLKSKEDIIFFTQEYFSDERNPYNDNNLIPEDTDLDVVPLFHRELCDMLNLVAWKETTNKIGWSCPRGHAKTTYLSNVFPLYSIVFELRKYILLISETSDMSEKFIEWVAFQLKHNKKLQNDFGILLHKNKLKNEKDNNEEFVTTNNIKVQASSTGRQLRGSRHGAYRPDLVILDDLESEKNTNTKELRDKNLTWYNKVISPIGDPKRTAFIYMGTLVHGGGLLPKVLSMTDYNSRIYSAIVEPPVHEEMWENVYEMLTDPSIEDRLDKAWDYYCENQTLMDEGVKVLWEERYPYFELMRIKADIGSRAFASEYLNKSSHLEDAIFNPEKFLFYTEKDLFYNDGTKREFDLIGFWDIAYGKNARSDYNAVILLGKDRVTGELFVLDAWASKCQMHIAMLKCIDIIKKRKPHVFVIETVAGQYDAYRQMREILTKDGIYFTKLVQEVPRTKKEERIESLEPLFENGTIRMKENMQLLIEMLEQYPNHDYDDLPDALSGAVHSAKNLRKRTYDTKPVQFDKANRYTIKEKQKVPQRTEYGSHQTYNQIFR